MRLPKTLGLILCGCVLSAFWFLPAALGQAPTFQADPFERAWHESEMYLRWMTENMWLFVPAQAFTRQWLESFKEFPPQGGTTLGIDGVIKQLENPASRQ